MRSFVVCYPQRVRESSEQKTPCSLAPGCFGQIGRPGFQDSASCTNAAHIFGEPQLIKQMPLMIIFYFSAHLLSLPSRGAWIEIIRRSRSHRPASVAPLAGSVDRNRLLSPILKVPAGSLPSRGAWIEMLHCQAACSPRASLPSRGAWIEINSLSRFQPTTTSLPSRGAWIEMRLKMCWTLSRMVAPLAGSVDRNIDRLAKTVRKPASLPSRGAWIEIPTSTPSKTNSQSRSPRGERG